MGQTATFSVTASGTPVPTYQWIKNGTAIGGATSSSYTTPVTVLGDNSSQFTVVVSNAIGSITSSAATLTVTASAVAPSIITQPVSVTVGAGQTASFSITAAGTGPLAYHWSKNGTPIGGATAASYTTPATTSSDNGSQFTVVVTNSVNSITSNAGILTVNSVLGALTPNFSALPFGNVNTNATSTLPVIFTNSGTANITISNVSVSGAGYGASGIPVGQILTGGQTATLNVTFTPAGTGSVPGSATVTSNASNSPVTVTLSGTGVQPVVHSVTLGWIASSSTGVTGYNVYSATTSGGYTTPVNPSPITGTTFTDSTVQGGQTYFYVVTAIDAGVESLHSIEVSVMVP